MVAVRTAVSPKQILLLEAIILILGLLLIVKFKVAVLSQPTAFVPDQV